MVSSPHWLRLFLCLAGATALAAPLAAQSQQDGNLPPSQQPMPVTVNPLPGLPRPPDQPANLYAPMPPQPYCCGDGMPAKYFQADPLLDPPGLQPGWFTSVQATWSKPAVNNAVFDFVQVGLRPAPDLVNVPINHLSGTVIPRIEIGYRLPSGFGGFSLVYRGLSSSGNSQLQSDNVANLSSHLDFNVLDLDYVSREWSLGPNFRMDWRIGARLVYFYLDSQANQPFNAITAAGSGIVSQQVTTSHNGFGPHCGLELTYNLPCAGLALVGNCDIAGTIGRIKQGFYETALDPITSSLTSAGINQSSSQPLANVIGRAGLAWRPPTWSNFQVFTGFEYDYWWEVGRMGSLGLVAPFVNPNATVWDRGILLRLQVDW